MKSGKFLPPSCAASEDALGRSAKKSGLASLLMRRDDVQHRVHGSPYISQRERRNNQSPIASGTTVRIKPTKAAGTPASRNPYSFVKDTAAKAAKTPNAAAMSKQTTATTFMSVQEGCGACSKRTASRHRSMLLAGAFPFTPRGEPQQGTWAISMGTACVPLSRGLRHARSGVRGLAPSSATPGGSHTSSLPGDVTRRDARLLRGRAARPPFLTLDTC